MAIAVPEPEPPPQKEALEVQLAVIGGTSGQRFSVQRQVAVFLAQSLHGYLQRCRIGHRVGLGKGKENGALLVVEAVLCMNRY